MSSDKYPSIFSCHMDAIVYVDMPLDWLTTTFSGVMGNIGLLLYEHSHYGEKKVPWYRYVFQNFVDTSELPFLVCFYFQAT